MKKTYFFYLLFSLVLIAANAQNPVMDFKTIDEMKQSHEIKQSHDEIKQPKVPSVNFNQLSIKSVADFAKKAFLKRAPLQAKEDIELLDSVIIANRNGLYTRTDYEYDNQGNKTLQVSSMWQADPGLWVGYTKYEYVHGVNEENDKTLIQTRYQWNLELSKWIEQEQYDYVFQQHTSSYKIRISKKWDVATSAWIPESKDVQLYDDGDYDYSWASYIWENDKWKGESKAGYIINEEGGFDELISLYFIADEEGVWQAKMTFELNKKGDFVSEAMYEWVNAESYWKGLMKSTNNYNADKGLNEKIEYLWDDASKDWMNSTLIESTTDAFDRPTYYADYTWDAANSSWVGVSFFKKDYNEDGQISMEENYTWHPINNNWVLTNEYTCIWADAGDGSWAILMKFESTYDLNGLKIERIQFYRTNLQTAWDRGLTWKGEYTYDDNDLNSHISFYSWDDENKEWVLFEKSDFLYNENGSIFMRTDYALESDSWVLTGETTYYYSTLVSANNNPAYSIALQTYPNPARDVIVVSGTKSGQLIRVLKADGSLLGTYTAQDDKTQINLSAYADGVLLLNIEKETMKIVKTMR